ncbi:MAG: DUF2961 domain-containing protein [Polyangiales bacterium]
MIAVRAQGVVLLLAAAGCAADREPDAPSSVVSDALRVASAQMDWRALPVLQPSDYHQFSSRDPDEREVDWLDKGNKDFNHFLAVCGERPALREQTSDDVDCEPGHEGYLLAADDGPGRVTRFFMPATARDGFGRERIRIYVDDLREPAYEAALQDWRRGAAAPFLPPLTTWTSGALVSRVAITYQKHLRILLDGLNDERLYYYQVALQRGAASDARPLHESAEELSQLSARVQNAADADERVSVAWQLTPGRETTVLDLTGPATLLQLHVRSDDSRPLDLAHTQLRIYWDGAREPAVDVALSELLGGDGASRPFVSLPLSLRRDDGGLTLDINWPMPFDQRARITLTSRTDRSAELQACEVRAALKREPPDPDAGYFHITRRSRRGPFAHGERYEVAALRGPGKYVGTLLQMRGQLDPESANPHSLGFLEGDERVVVDGRTVSEGTGTEDYFDAGWYFRDGPFTTLFGGVFALDHDEESGHAAAVRFHLFGDAIGYREDFGLSFEYGADRPNSASAYDSLAFHYAREP